MAESKKHIDVNIRDDLGAQPIHIAAFRGNLELVKSLVENGADVNSKGPGDATPLHDAVTMSHAKVKGADYEGIVCFLIEKGADVNAKNKMGYLPLDFAKNKKVIELLRKAGAKKKKDD
ncbi:MAG: ankyrin repeat domain-containing protein [Candidatus Micrarchaeota archaeon]|nr:ankyrin repeat domain-containing protein [Candidatus Micrarchaeota archaeon]